MSFVICIHTHLPFKSCRVWKWPWEENSDPKELSAIEAENDRHTKYQTVLSWEQWHRIAKLTGHNRGTIAEATKPPINAQEAYWKFFGIFCSSQEALSWHFSNFTTLIHHFLILWPILCLVLLVVSHRLWTACLLTGQCLLQSWCSSGSDPLMTYDMQSKRVKCPDNVDIARSIAPDSAIYRKHILIYWSLNTR